MTAGYVAAMAIWHAIVGLVLLVASLAYAGWKTWQLGQQGRKDQFWFWSYANRKATFILVILGSQIVGRWVWSGWSDEVLYFIILGVILVPIPYIAYITGRLLGIRDRERHGVRLS
jgi:hypothetical protein